MTTSLYLVTGGSGFLGSTLVDQLASEGHRVRVLARDKNWYLNRVKQSTSPAFAKLVEFWEGSVNDVEALRAAAEGVQGIFHLAGAVVHSHEPALVEAMRRTNVDGTLNVIQVAADSGKVSVVYASTSGVVGCTNDSNFIAGDSSEYCEEAVRNFPYYAQKIEAERQSIEKAKLLGVPLKIMRPTLILGPGDVRLSSIRLVRDFMKRTIPFVPSGGLSFVDVRDAASAFISAMKKAETEKGLSNAEQAFARIDSYVLASYNGRVKDFFDKLEELTQVKAPRMSAPTWAVILGARILYKVTSLISGKRDPSIDPVFAEMGTLFWYVDISDNAAARRELRWKTRSPDQTLRDTIEWLKLNEQAIALYEKESAKLSLHRGSGANLPPTTSISADESMATSSKSGKGKSKSKSASPSTHLFNPHSQLHSHMDLMKDSELKCPFSGLVSSSSSSSSSSTASPSSSPPSFPSRLRWWLLGAAFIGVTSYLFSHLVAKPL